MSYIYNATMQLGVLQTSPLRSEVDVDDRVCCAIATSPLHASLGPSRHPDLAPVDDPELSLDTRTLFQTIVRGIGEDASRGLVRKVDIRGIGRKSAVTGRVR